MCHNIDYEGRLDVDSPTVPLAELLLQKLQIVQTNEKDVQDTIILLLEHEIGKTDKNEINEDHIAKVLADDWGFYYTVNTKIGEIKQRLDKYEALSAQDKALLVERLDKLQKRIEQEPKGFQWKMRAKAGPSVKWYRVVEEVQRD